MNGLSDPSSQTLQPSSGPARVSVLLVDAHPLVRDGVARLLEDGGLDVIGQASSFAEGADLAERTHADVIVVDVSLGDGSGIDLVSATRCRHPHRGVVVLALHDDDDKTLLATLDAGASSLVLKAASCDEVLAMVRRAATSPGSFTAVGLGNALRRRWSQVKPSLTPRETEVLERLVVGDSVSGMANRLYMSESTVKTHIAKLNGKLGAHNRASAVMAAIRLGLVKS